MQELEHRLTRHQAEVERHFQALRGPETLDFLGNLQEMGAEARRRAGPDPRDEAVHLLDELADAFPAATPAQRQETARQLSCCPALQRMATDLYLGRAYLKLAQRVEGDWVTRAATMIALAGLGPDYRDVLVALRGLTHEAEQQGLDWRTALRKVAALTADPSRSKFLETQTGPP